MVLDGWRRPLLLAGACWAVFVVLLVAAYLVPVFEWADGWAVQGFLNLQSPRLSDVAYGVGKLADPAPFALITIAIALAALRQGRPRHAAAAVVLLVGANALTQVLKVVLQHPRPHDFLGKAQLADAAFPSGHATASMSIALAAVLVAPVAWRPVVAAAGALYALAVSESIMLLAWHFPSDIAGGFLVAAACWFATAAALRAAEARWPERRGREAARRALGSLRGTRALVLVASFTALALVGVMTAAGDLGFVDRHTTAVAAAVAVAALASALPVAVAARYR